MDNNSRRLFLKTVGLAVGSVGIAGANVSNTSKAVTKQNSQMTDITGNLPNELNDSNWGTFQFDAGNTGHNPNARAVRETPWIGWTEYLGHANSPELSAPAIVDGVAYLAADDGKAIAYDVEEHEVLWQNTYTDRFGTFDAAPTVTDGKMYISYWWKVFALDTETGALLWTFENPAYDPPADECDAPELGTSSTTVVDGTVYVKMRIDGQGYAYAFSAVNGDVKWSAEISGDGDKAAVTADEIPAVADDTAYFVDRGTVYAFDTTDGTKQWDVSVHTGSRATEPVLEAPTVVDGTVYLTSNYQDESGDHGDSRSFLTALSAADGSSQWQHELNGNIHLTSPVFSDDSVYVGEGELLWAFDGKNGNVRWKSSESDELRYTNVAELSVAGSTVYYPRKVKDEDVQEVAAFNAGDGSLQWQVPLRTDGNAPTGCALVDDTAYVAGDAGFLYTITGLAENWRQMPELDNGETFEVIISDDTSVYVATNSELFAFERTSGTEQWRVPFDSDDTIFRHVWATVTNGTVYCTVGGDGGSSINFAYAFDAASGTKRWEKQVEDGTGVPVVVNNVVYFGSQSSLYGSAYVFAVNADNGNILWNTEIDSDDPSDSVRVNGAVTVQDGLVYAPSSEGAYAFEADDGNEKWMYDGETSAVAANDETVFVTNEGLTALNSADGTEAWSTDVGGEFLSSVNDTLFVVNKDDIGDTERLFALDNTNGTERWSFDTNVEYGNYDRDATLTNPTIVDDTVYVGSDDRRVYVLDADGGETLQRFELFGNPQAAPAVRNDTVYVVTEGRVYSFV
ncbi:hypothetical protein GCM10025751_28240 [Haladaptatus pallidirubidus]|uniref:Pyrrolo-quinoline quinone repeat domain-containing protein n=1 Tax=Haladaptatus pallidirubidus TaxID=1008152 RepID=A0AAV3UIS3_9EURY